ncbi:gamma-glutamylcyclotransferase [Anatilimnocola sp. NA78]|uniref:gamma-glutamylcyclotransferase family protein n=1 Tax=Anatilimnocola sp. NA78 TaxID=3415683 RepID=UPI003CE48733
MTTKKSTLVFVYGTLRRGGSRAIPDRFPAAKFLGKARVTGHLFDLQAAGDHYPGLLLDENGTAVFGEVYEVDEKTLRRLDAIEGDSGDPGSSLFSRTATVAYSQTAGQRWDCFAYEFNRLRHPYQRLIRGGDWIKYLAERGNDK